MALVTSASTPNGAVAKARLQLRIPDQLVDMTEADRRPDGMMIEHRGISRNMSDRKAKAEAETRAGVEAIGNHDTEGVLSAYCLQGFRRLSH